MRQNYVLLNAIRNGTYADCERALQEGGSPNARDLYHLSPLSTCDKYERNDVARLLIKHGADLNERIGRRQDTLLHRAIVHGNLTFAGLLLEYDLSPNLANKSGQTALHMAAKRDFEYFAVELLKRGAESNVQDSQGNTPLHIAARYGAIGCLKQLLQYGGKINQLNCKKYSPLHEAVLAGNLEAVNLLLRHGGHTFTANPSILSSAKQIAISQGHESIALAMESHIPDAKYSTTDGSFYAHSDYRSR